MHSNLMSDDKELEYLLILLEINLGPKYLDDLLTESTKEKIKLLIESLESDLSVFSKTCYSVADVDLDDLGSVSGQL